MHDNSGNLEPALEVYKPDGTRILSISGDNTNVRVDTLTLPTTGLYSLFASDVGSNALGAYGLFLDKLQSPASAAGISYGSLQRDTLINTAQIKMYTFNGSTGDILVAMMSDSLNPMEPMLSLYSPAGVLLSSTWNNDFTELDTVPLSATGSYTLLAEDNGSNDTGVFGMFLQKTNPPSGATPIIYGSQTVDSLTRMAQIRSYSFTAGLNDTVYIKVEENSFIKSTLEVYDPAGTKLISSTVDGLLTISPLLLTSAGDYSILLHDDNGTNTGSYTLTLIENPPVFSGLPDTIRFPADSTVLLNIWSLVSDADQPDSSLSYTFFSSNDSLLRSYDSASGILTLSATAGYTGTATLTLRAVDANNLRTDASIIVTVSAPSQTTLVKPVTAGWNMLGLPSTTSDMFYKSVFPSANNNSLFGFNGSYFLEDTFQVGVGYWLNFPADTTYNITGKASYQLSLTLMQGWNMISGPACNVALANISDPGSIITPNSLFEFNGAYAASDTVEQGKGYWLNANATGVITLTCSGFKTIPEKPLAYLDWETLPALHIRASGGAEQSLYFGVLLDEELPQAARQLPPTPPAGAFDARFRDDYRLINGVEGLIRLQAPRYPLSVEVSNLQHSDLGSRPLFLVEMREGKEVRSHRLSDGALIRISDPRVHTLKLTQDAAVPATFEVWQNYPNPFNPSTQIKFAIPEKSRVEVAVFNSLGQKVKTLLNATREPGFYTVTWDGKSDAGFRVSSGIYFYKVKYTDHSRVMKMILLR